MPAENVTGKDERQDRNNVQPDKEKQHSRMNNSTPTAPVMKQPGLRDITLNSILEVYRGPHIGNDIVLVDDFSRMPLPADTARMQCLLVAICLQGTATYTVDTVKRTVHANDLLVISNNQKTSNGWMSPDCRGIGLLLSYDFFHEIVKNVHEMSSLFIFARFHPVYALLPEEVERMKTYFDMIRAKMGNLEHHFRKETVQSLITTMIYDFSNALYRTQNSASCRNTSAEKIFARFIHLVEDNFRTQRRLSWYGQQLCITPKYLYGAVKAVSSITPTDWIDNYVTLEIKLLLRNTTKSIKEIAQDMNFSSQSFLGKYFKERVGMSPKEYRNG